MKYAESYPADANVLELVKKLVPDAFATNLREGGVNLVYPKDKDLELKVKYDTEEDGGSIMLKISWNEEEIETEEEDEDKEED